jgi:hypothetical protein
MRAASSSVTPRTAVPPALVAKAKGVEGRAGVSGVAGAGGPFGLVRGARGEGYVGGALQHGGDAAGRAEVREEPRLGRP